MRVDESDLFLHILYEDTASEVWRTAENVLAFAVQ
jgi:hypothetical protein